MKYILYTDHKAGLMEEQDGYQEMEATTLVDAMAEADNKWDDTIYLMRIMEKVGKITRTMTGTRVETYEAVICRRSYGWHPNTIKYSENEHRVTKNWQEKDEAWYRIA